MSVKTVVRKIDGGAKWWVKWDGSTIGKGIECCERCAWRSATRRIESLACSAAFADDEVTERECADAIALSPTEGSS